MWWFIYNIRYIKTRQNKKFSPWKQTPRDPRPPPASTAFSPSVGRTPSRWGACRLHVRSPCFACSGPIRHLSPEPHRDIFRQSHQWRHLAVCDGQFPVLGRSLSCRLDLPDRWSLLLSCHSSFSPRVLVFLLCYVESSEGWDDILNVSFISTNKKTSCLKMLN